MKRVLLIGGYGGFGARIALRLAAEGYEVLVAGRSLQRARAFCAGRSSLVPLEIDRDTGMEKALRKVRPWAVVDAAGPFQGADYRVAGAAIAASAHYLDIADARAFVCGIDVLHAEAVAAEVAIISGASSLPALSGAVVGKLAEGLDMVEDVEIVLSASSRGTAGPSVASAILSYLGRPIRLWRDGSWVTGHGWQQLRRHRFELSGRAPLRGRLAGLADVPDLALLPARLPGRPAVTFRAGTDMAFHNLGLWLLSWPVRWGWFSAPEKLGPLLSRLQRLTGWAGSKRSAMRVRMIGTAEGRRVERCWTLLAEAAHGPEIPSLAVPIILKAIEGGDIGSGARDAGELLLLEDFLPAFEGLAVWHKVEEVEHMPLYARLLGARFGRLPAAVRAIHTVVGGNRAAGRGTVERGDGLVARLLAALFRFPPAGQHSLLVSFEARGGSEHWTRDFSGHRFASRLRRSGDRLEECFGPFRFAFDLAAGAGGLEMHLVSWKIGPVPMPLALGPRTAAREWEEDGRFSFDVSIMMPWAGPIVRYRGWLEPN